MSKFLKFGGVFVMVAVLVALSFGGAFAQIPTPAAELFDGEATVGTAWPLVLIFLGILTVPFALVFGKSITKWVAGLITRYGKK